MVKLIGVKLSSTNGAFVMNQVDYIEYIEKVSLHENLTIETFRSVRAKYAYGAFSMVPDAFVYVALLA